MNELKGQEVFAVGTWNGMKFDEADLDNIVRAFEKLGERHQVPLKLGHNDEQPLTDGQPALGWVTRVYKRGQKLLADFSDVPTLVKTAIEKKLYRNVSAELLLDVRHGRDKFPIVLDAIALLGADHPAVNTLRDLQAISMSRAGFAGGRRACLAAVSGNYQTSQEEADMEKEIEELRKEFKSFREETTATVQKLQGDLKTSEEARLKAEQEAQEFKAKLDEKEAADGKAKVELARKSVNETLDAAVKAKSITPAQRAVFAKQLGVDDDERVVTIDLEEARVMFSLPKDEGRRAFSADHQDGEQHQEGDADDRLTAAATKIFNARDGKITFSRALEIAATENPELAREYADHSYADA